MIFVGPQKLFVALLQASFYHLFIGPMSDGWLPLSVTRNKLTTEVAGWEAEVWLQS